HRCHPAGRWRISGGVAPYGAEMSPVPRRTVEAGTSSPAHTVEHPPPCGEGRAGGSSGRCAHPRLLRLDQVPAVAVEVLEHRHGAIGLVPRRLEKKDAVGGEGCKIATEIVGLEEEADPPAGLVADGRHLLLVRGARQQQPGAAPTGGGHQHPALAIPEGAVGDEVEAEAVAVPRDGRVVVGNDEGNRGEAGVHAPWWQTPRRRSSRHDSLVDRLCTIPMGLPGRGVIPIARRPKTSFVARSSRRGDFYCPRHAISSGRFSCDCSPPCWLPPPWPS